MIVICIRYASGVRVDERPATGRVLGGIAAGFRLFSGSFAESTALDAGIVVAVKEVFVLIFNGAAVHARIVVRPEPGAVRVLSMMVIAAVRTGENNRR